MKPTLLTFNLEQFFWELRYSLASCDLLPTNRTKQRKNGIEVKCVHGSLEAKRKVVLKQSGGQNWKLVIEMLNRSGSC